jgi:nucleoside-diphosphate-sugar epimerase
VVNIGSGTDLPILELAKQVAETVGFTGRLETDPSMPDGTPRKLLDISRIRSLGWEPRIPLREGLAATYADCLSSGVLDN